MARSLPGCPRVDRLATVRQAVDEILQHYLYNPALEIPPDEKGRLVNILAELGLLPMDEKEEG